jgi:lipoprotein-anchoring transpeptidase ErfK/SrfK
LNEAAKMTDVIGKGRVWIAAGFLAALLLVAAILVAVAGPAPAETPQRPVAAVLAAASPGDELIPAPPPVAVEAPAAGLAVRTLMPITRWLKSGEYAWNDEAAAAGPVTIVVDIRARTLSVYRAGVEIGRSSVIYGADNKPTPLGTFSILMKKADHYSSTYDNAPMPFTLRLTQDGVAIHGAELADDVATHGCVGLPIEFAELLFAQAELGGRVIIVGGPPAGAPYTTYAALPYPAPGA